MSWQIVPRHFFTHPYLTCAVRPYATRSAPTNPLPTQPTTTGHYCVFLDLTASCTLYLHAARDADMLRPDTLLPMLRAAL